MSKIFIASSTEGLEVAKTVKSLLEHLLGKNVEIFLWTRKFELSDTYIESLEKAAAENDFAIMVLTPDDITTSRKNKRLAPRDNVVFELGLFMGCLGRQRCFIVHEDKPELKMPTDLLGIKTATFKLSSDRALKKPLYTPCQSISERITDLGIRYKLNSDALTEQNAIRSFCRLIEGAWWERINRPGLNALSYIRIESDLLFNTVSLAGKSYDKNGSHIANWKSLLTRVEKDELRILYHWEGWHTLPDIANIPFHGFGQIEFDKPAYPENTVIRGKGKFWDINEAHPENTIIKPIELHRIHNKNTVGIIDRGKEKDIRLIVKKTLEEW